MFFQTADFSSPSAPAAEDVFTPGSSISSFIDDPPPLYSNGSEAETLSLVDPPAENSEEIEMSSVQYPRGDSPCFEENPDPTPVAVVSPLPAVSAPAVPVIPNSPSMSHYLVPPLVRRNRD